MSDDEDFEEQLRMEKEEKEKREELNHGKTKVDDDGTEMEWDADKGAWFPKIDANFIAQYQMSYGSYQDEGDKKEGDKKESTGATGYSLPPGAPAVTDPSYAQWYYNWYNQAGQKAETKTTASKDSQNYSSDDYYKYYEQHQGETKEGESANYDEEANKEYWEKYYEYYYGQQQEEAEGGKQKEEKAETKKDKKARKRKQEQQQNQGWFDIEEQHNTNVYVSGLPTDITEEEFETTMKKCGLLMFDPRIKKPKLKLYKDAEGNLKGDGLCCYIKSESVDLALQILDGYNVRGHTLSVTKAEFKMKGNFDSSKKKKRLTNKEKKRFKEHQEKLFGWKLDKLARVREKHEKTVIIKSLFDPLDFEKNPELIQRMRDDLRDECKKYGDVKRVVIYDRHKEGVGTVSFAEADEADQCIQSMNERFFQKRQVFVETWDGKTKFKVEETDEERQKRLAQWGQFLETGGEESKQKPEEKKSQAASVDTGIIHSVSETENMETEGGKQSDKTEDLTDDLNKEAKNEDQDKSTSEDNTENKGKDGQSTEASS